MASHAPTMSPRFYARVAGVSYLLISIFGVIGVGLPQSKLLVPDNNAATIDNIVAHDLLFRFGIVSVLVIYASVVVLSWALYELLKPVDRSLALLALLLRMAEAIVGASTILLSFVVLLLVDGSAALETAQMHALVAVFLDANTAGLDIVLFFIGLGGTVFCYLLFTSQLIPRTLAGWSMFTYLSMLVLSLVSILVPDHPALFEHVLYGAGGLFELVIGLWLLVKGVDLERWQRLTAASPTR